MDPFTQRSIAERTTQQLGHITSPQLRLIGVSSRQERTLVDRGWFVRVGLRTLRATGVPRTYEGDVMAACLDLDAIASHPTALWLHHIARRRWPPPIHVSVRKSRQATHSDLAIVHTSTNLGPDDICVVKGIPVTSIARTIFGMAALVPEVPLADVRDIVDVAIRDGKASDAWLCWRLEQLRCRGRNGVSVLEGILADREGTGRTESWLEREFLALLGSAGFPLPRVQQRIAPKGKPISRVDFLYEPKLVLEVNGYGTHSTRRQTSADARRRNRLQLAGYDVVEFTYEHVRDDPGYVLTTVAEHAGFPLPVLQPF